MGLFGTYMDYINKRRDYSGGLTDRFRWDLSSPAFSEGVRERIARAREAANLAPKIKQVNRHQASIYGLGEVGTGIAGDRSSEHSSDRSSEHSSNLNSKDFSFSTQQTEAEVESVGWAGLKGAALGALPGVATAVVASQAPGLNFGKALSLLGSKIGMDALGGALKGSVDELAAQTLKAAGYVGRWAKGVPAVIGILDDAASPFGFGIPPGLKDVAQIGGAILGDALGDALDSREIEGFRDMMESHLDPDIGKALAGMEIAKIGTELDPFGTRAMQKSLAATVAQTTNMSLGEVMMADQPSVSSDDIGLISNPETMANALRSGYQVNEYGYISMNSPLAGTVNLDLDIDPYSYDFQPMNYSTNWLTMQNTMFDQQDKEMLQSMSPLDVGKAYDSLTDSLSTAFGNIGSWGMDRVNDAADALGSAVDGIGKAVSDGWDSIGESLGFGGGGSSSGRAQGVNADGSPQGSPGGMGGAGTIGGDPDPYGGGRGTSYSSGEFDSGGGSDGSGSGGGGSRSGPGSGLGGRSGDGGGDGSDRPGGSNWH